MTGKPAVPTTGAVGSREWLIQLAKIANRHNQGWLNTGGLLTLAANVATTTLTDSRISIDSTVALVPTTANAAAELGNGTLYMLETGRVNGSIVVTHANNAQTDRVFRVIIIG